LPIAVVEAKDNHYPIGGGMQQAPTYAEALDVPFVFSSNSGAFVFHDRTGLSHPVESTLSLQEFPSPGQLWSRYRT
jgi:type I restriction enzyme, R subunit